MNIVIVGGGTAGWITALYAKKIYPNFHVVLIESEEIGILGAGEGTTPHLISLLDFLEIPSSDIIKYCNATIKTGIKYSGWNSKKTYDYHSFNAKYPISEQTENLKFNGFLETSFSKSFLYAAINNDNRSDFVFSHKLSEQNKVPFIKNKNIKDYFIESNQLGPWALHIDAVALAKYLQRVAISRGIVRIEGIVSGIETDYENRITSLKTKNNKTINCDFVFDCTGFKRLIIGKFYSSEWISYEKYLTTDRAMPFFLDIDKKIPPHTEAIAMEYGWMWKTPVQNRYGCGYVFNSSMISDDQAKQEVESLIKQTITIPKFFKFNPGVYKEIWIKNCVAIGLSAGFVEPLEGVAIQNFIFNLKNFFSQKDNLYCKNKAIIDRYNKQNVIDSNEVAEFLNLQFITDKNNSIFWKEARVGPKMEFIEYILEISKYRLPNKSIDFKYKSIFPESSYSLSLIKNHILSSQDLINFSKNVSMDNIEEYFRIKNDQNKAIELCVDHDVFLLDIKNA